MNSIDKQEYIGYKEFEDYIKLKTDDPKEKEEVLSKCIATLKKNTRRYARTQLGWIKHRLLTKAPIYKFYSTDLSKWNEVVKTPALALAVGKSIFFVIFFQKRSTFEYLFLAFQQGLKIDDSYLCAKTTPQYATQVGEWKKFTCELCQKELNGEKEWQVHLKSRSHQKTKRNLKKKAQMPASKELVGEEEGED